MHEWALAEAIVAAASEIAEKKHLKEVTEVRIRKHPDTSILSPLAI